MFVELLCISSCDSKSDCLIVIFDSKNDVETPFYLFPETYNTSELISSVTSNLYLKHCQKISIHFIFILKKFILFSIKMEIIIR
jgi:hypothetical protein